MNNIYHKWKLGILLAWLVSTYGCTPSPSTSGPSNTNSASSNAKAVEILDACLDRYKKLKSYEDRAILRRRIPSEKNGGVPVDNVEKSSFAFERPNRLAIQAYNLRGCWTGSSWEAVVGQGVDKPFGNQRLIRPLPDLVDLQWLGTYELPILLTRPGVGQPIQLELLLAQKPLDIIRSVESKFSLLSPESFDSGLCDRVLIEHRGYKWILWIDQKEKLLRKMDLPPEGLFPSTTALKDFQDIVFSLEFIDARGDSSIDWSQWKIPDATQDDVAVRKLVAAPPSTISPIVGKILEPFDLGDSNGIPILDSAQRNKRFTILCWLSNDESGQSFCKDLLELQRELEKRKLNSIAQLLLVTQSPGGELIESLKKWNCQIPLAVDSKGLTQSIFQIQNTPSVVVLDGRSKVQFAEVALSSAAIDYLPTLIERLRDGEDIADRELQSFVDDQARFIAELHRAVIDKTQAEKLPPIPLFQFLQHSMKREWVVDFKDALLGAGGESSHLSNTGADKNTTIDFSNSSPTGTRVMTVLNDLGQIYAVNSNGTKRSLASIPVEQADGAKRIHAIADPWTHQWIALVPEGLPRYWIVNAPREPATSDSNRADVASQFQIPNNETAVAFAWTNRNATTSLTIATDGSSILSHDPTTDVVKEAKFNSPALAIVPGLNANGECYEWNVIQANRNITRILSLPSNESDSNSSGIEIEARQNSVSFPPDSGAWLWGRNANDAYLAGLGHLSTGETGLMVLDQKFQPFWNLALSVRPEQCRLLSSATTTDGTLYWLASGPNRILHLITADGRIADKASFGARIVGAAIYPSADQLKLIVALENQVSCWTLIAAKPAPIQAPPESVNPAKPN